MKDSSFFNLLNEYDFLWKRGLIKEEVPNHIKSNLNDKFTLRRYQIEAFARFQYYMANDQPDNTPTHLLFQMATGSGKTLIMAGALLHLYRKGYRNFIFLVNRKNIIEKTRDNFLNRNSAKFLFNKDKIEIDGKIVDVQEVKNFDEARENAINILFTTIQGLQSSILNPRENRTNIEDLKGEKLVLISDESHHINVLTKRNLNKEDKDNSMSWQQTVEEILESDSDNILLDFTATAELNHPLIAKEYDDKLLFNYDLKQFREDKYSKEVFLLQSDLSVMDRVLQALILSQYRLKISQDNKISLKPVVLIKSKTIPDSRNIEHQFHQVIQELNSYDLSELRNKAQAPIIQEAFQYFSSKGISLENLAYELKMEFANERTISVNEKNESEEKQIAVNTLENRENPYRVVFVVDKLNEGWDVLNLFDIVRTDETKGSEDKTIQEAQLIGRGARYFPFSIESEAIDNDQKFKRKFDNEQENELRLLETMHFHSINNNEYINEITKKLQANGMLDEDREKIKVSLDLKDDFKGTNLYKYGGIYLNRKVPNDFRYIKQLSDFNTKNIYDHTFYTGFGREHQIFEDESQLEDEIDTVVYPIVSFGAHVCRTAIDKLPFYRFSNLKKYFPELTSINKFIKDEKYLGSIYVRVRGNTHHIKDLKPSDEIQILVSVLQQIMETIQSNAVNYRGTEVFYRHAVNKIVKEKVSLTFSQKDKDSDAETGVSILQSQAFKIDLNQKDKEWYVYSDNYGTSEEKYLIRYLDENIEDLKDMYNEIFLIRNDNKMFQIYRFSDGQAFEPDFVLFLSDKSNNNMKYYQIFVEPKGKHLMKPDALKEEFLKEIENKYEIEELFNNQDIRIIGLPFYNEEERRSEFHKKLKSINF